MKSDKIRLIALDLDGTLLNAAGRLSEKNKAALLRAIEGGVYIAVATGRAFFTIPQEIREIPGIEYVITSNGAAIYQVRTGEPVVNHTLTPEAVTRIIELTKDEGERLAHETFIGGRAYASSFYVQDPLAHGATAKGAVYVRSTRTPVEDMPSFMLEHADRLDAVDLVLQKEEEKPRWHKLLERELPEVYITSSLPKLLEISDRQSGKHNALAWLIQHYRVAADQTAAFGDADNDAEMLRLAGAGVAMENATAAAKAAAAYITCHHDRDGVAQAFEEYLGI